MAHEQTRLYYEKLKEIVTPIIRNNKRRSFMEDQIIDDGFEVLEIGLDVGISARCFLEFPQIHLTSVDSGDVSGGVKHIEEWGWNNRWTFKHVKSDFFFLTNDKKFDIIFIDGDHSYEQTKKDIYGSWNCLEEGGLLVGHDYLHKGNFTENPDYGVHQAFREFLVDVNLPATIYPPNPGIIAIKKP